MRSFRLIDWRKKEDRQHFLCLLDSYMKDPMGEHPSLDQAKKDKLIKDLQNLSQAYIFLCFDETKPIGTLTAFETYSTFLGAKSFNIHDFFIQEEVRKQGNGRFLMESFLSWARGEGAKKVTLEVRYDNEAAKALYSKMGFGETDPPMHFYTKKW